MVSATKVQRALALAVAKTKIDSSMAKELTVLYVCTPQVNAEHTINLRMFVISLASEVRAWRIR